MDHLNKAAAALLLGLAGAQAPAAGPYTVSTSCSAATLSTRKPGASWSRMKAVCPSG